MTEYLDFTVAPFRHILGPVYDAYRKVYEYVTTASVQGQFVSTIEGTPLPDTAEDRRHNFYYSVYGPPDNPVKAGVVGTGTVVKMQTVPVPPTYNRGDSNIIRPVEWLPPDVEMREHFVDMPFTLPTTLRASTVATKHS